ncbi:hypothetical protein NKW55_15950 [Gluconobacter kondonii]|uniref:hypothetical protein n=1 Tax=Gluconobacter kondonii TaxID=941463 RepID=UPI00209E308A|nr:hypothetical protein [Gluconobacter kondonii]MCP1238026.1 hypothetical protein [Gluconobacter kondonii]
MRWPNAREDRLGIGQWQQANAFLPHCLGKGQGTVSHRILNADVKVKQFGSLLVRAVEDCRDQLDEADLTAWNAIPFQVDGSSAD